MEPFLALVATVQVGPRRDWYGLAPTAGIQGWLANRLGSAAREMARERFDSRLVQSAVVDFIADL